MDNLLVANLLKDLMMHYNRVSLPCLGSFMGQYQAASISADGLLIYPPSKSIAFHQNEIWNDEKLERLLADKKHISLGKAKEELAFWIDDVCLSLSSGEEVVLPQLGRLRVNSENKLIFDQDADCNVLIESFGLAHQQLPPIKQPVNILRPSPQFVHQLDHKKGMSNFFISILIIFVLLVVVALVWYFVNGKQNTLPSLPKHEIANSSIPVALPSYSINIGQFQHYNEARALRKQFEQQGYQVSLLSVNSILPYQVNIGLYQSESTAKAVLEQLLIRDTGELFMNSSVIRTEGVKWDTL